MYVLDTNVISELRKAKTGKANAGVVAWGQAVPANEMFISAITVMELETGVLQVSRRDPVQGSILRKWLNEAVMPEFRGRVLSIDSAVAIRCAALHVPDPRQERDALIAATALIHGMTVITRNVKDFEATGVPLFNPWVS
ncbi:type II toxin-antitoxin system VapC family toxin [Pseudomonas sp. Marseille-Q5115]|uniref:type II toxin-antitoxin system VapC family toxin n=1 Tax=Pseudomonas sp. Marseille-Q5115 TaxID=2866593 RepID=UPI001CE3D2F3|nr:type II toxin-antitoxin system VapC family toxin [Pseudomonas sp. Marseille-Q5115]